MSRFERLHNSIYSQIAANYVFHNVNLGTCHEKWFTNSQTHLVKGFLFSSFCHVTLTSLSCGSVFLQEGRTHNRVVIVSDFCVVFQLVLLMFHF